MAQSDFTALVRAAAESKYWKEQDAALVLSAWAESGRSLTSFAREWGINRGRLERWHRLLADRPTAAAQQLFHPVQLLVDEEQPRAAELELVLGNGRRIVVPRNFDEATFERLLRIADSTC